VTDLLLCMSVFQLNNLLTFLFVPCMFLFGLFNYWNISRTSCGFAVQTQLNGSRSCLEWRLLGMQGTLY